MTPERDLSSKLPGDVAAGDHAEEASGSLVKQGNRSRRGYHGLSGKGKAKQQGPVDGQAAPIIEGVSEPQGSPPPYTQEVTQARKRVRFNVAEDEEEEEAPRMNRARRSITIPVVESDEDVADTASVAVEPAGSTPVVSQQVRRSERLSGINTPQKVSKKSSPAVASVPDNGLDGQVTDDLQETVTDSHGHQLAAIFANNEDRRITHTNLFSMFMESLARERTLINKIAHTKVVIEKLTLSSGMALINKLLEQERKLLEMEQDVKLCNKMQKGAISMASEADKKAEAAEEKLKAVQEELVSSKEDTKVAVDKLRMVQEQFSAFKKGKAQTVD